jgi:hypothetical protein
MPPKDLTKTPTYDFGYMTIKRLIREIITTINQRTPELPEIDCESDPYMAKILDDFLYIFLDRMKKTQELKKPERRKSLVSIIDNNPLQITRRKSFVGLVKKDSFNKIPFK